MYYFCNRSNRSDRMNGMYLWFCGICKICLLQPWLLFHSDNNRSEAAVSTLEFICSILNSSLTWCQHWFLLAFPQTLHKKPPPNKFNQLVSLMQTPLTSHKTHINLYTLPVLKLHEFQSRKTYSERLTNQGSCLTTFNHSIGKKKHLLFSVWILQWDKIRSTIMFQAWSVMCGLGKAGK